MQTETKIRILISLLYLYTSIHVFLLFVGLLDTAFNDDVISDLLKTLIHLLMILLIAFFLPRKRSKEMYWVSAALLSLETARKVLGLGIFIWLQQSDYVTGFPIGLAVVYTFFFTSMTILIFQKDVRLNLSAPATAAYKEHLSNSNP